jgi:hypothetical protein
LVKRRGVLLGLGALGGLAAIVGWRFSQVTPEQAIVMVIRKRLAYLRLDEPGVQRFARELATKKDIGNYKLRVLAAAGRLYSDVSYPGYNAISNAIRAGEDRIVTVYLLSSDFFVMGADEGRTVQYLQLYDAMRACSNPFARPVTAQTG